MARRALSAGEMQHQVTLRAPTRVDDSGGGATYPTTNVATVWAKVEPLVGREELEAMQAGMTRPHRFRIYYLAGLTGTTEVVYSGRVFNVKSVLDPDEKHYELELLTDEVVG